MKKHKHADLIIQWANGAEIQVMTEPFTFNDDGTPACEWADCKTPLWDVASKYRIKPEKEYPKSTLTYGDLCDFISKAETVPGNEGKMTVALRICADEAIKEFIKSGEMDKYNQNLASNN